MIDQPRNLVTKVNVEQGLILCNGFYILGENNVV